jgi:hypothetical protein
VGRQAVELRATLPQRRKHLRGGLAAITVIDSVRLVKLGKVARDLGVDLLSFLGDPTLIEHAESAGRGTNLRTVDRYKYCSEQPLVAAKKNEGAAGADDGSAVVAPEISNRLVVGRETADEPHHLDVALALALEAARRADLVEVTVDVELQQVARIIARPASRSRGRSFETQR